MALRELIAKYVFDVEGGEKVASLDKKLSGLEGKLTGIGGALAGAVIVQGLRGMIGEMVDLGSSLDDTSQRLGIGVMDLQRWRFAAKLSGVEAGAFDSAVKKAQINITKAGEAGGYAGSVFEKLGVAVKDSNGQTRETTEIMGAVGAAVSEIEDPAKRTAMLVEAFGKAGSDLGPMFANGSEGLNDLLGEMDALGGGISEDAIGALAELGDNSDRFDMSMISLKSTILKAALPTLNKMVAGLSGFIGEISKSESATSILKVGLMALAGVGASIAYGLIAPFLPLALILAGIVLLIDELMVGMEGGDTVLGRLLDEIGGEGTSKDFFEWLKSTLADIKTFANDVLQAIKQIKNLGDDFTKKDASGRTNAEKAINDTLGTETDTQKEIRAMGEAGGARRRRLEAQARVESFVTTDYGSDAFKTASAKEGADNAAFPFRTGGQGLMGNIGNVALNALRKEVAINRETAAPGTALMGSPGGAGDVRIAGLDELFAELQSYKPSDEAAAAPAQEAPKGDTTNTLNANIAVNITAESDMAGAISDAVLAGLGPELRHATGTLVALAGKQ